MAMRTRCVLSYVKQKEIAMQTPECSFRKVE